MGIYISGVKGLPEQVQENKNKIKEVEEQIEGIDFDAIRELEGQVAENTQDINNIEASIGVQNQAINGLKDRADALDSKTQKITYDEDTVKTTIDSYTIINGNVDCDNVHIAGNGTFQNAKGSGLHFQEGPNDDEVCLVNKESGTSHYLTITADGQLLFDDQPVGAKPLYQHNITLTNTSATIKSSIALSIIKDDNTPITTKNEIASYLFNNLLTSNTTLYPASGSYLTGASKGIISGLYATGSSTLAFRYGKVDDGSLNTDTISTNFSVSDIVIQIA